MGKNLPTSRTEMVDVGDDGVLLGDVEPAGTDAMRHLLSVADLGAEGIEEVLRVTDSFVKVSERAIPRVPALRGKTVVSLFYEDSTRTRLSFETAAKRLSADVMGFSVGSSSVQKGESVRHGRDDRSHGRRCRDRPPQVPQAFHGRSPAGWMPRAEVADVSVINAGDGWHEHPTQALLDAYTVRQRLGSVAGKRIAIVGDIKHSRVARSNVGVFTTLGAEVTLWLPRPPCCHRRSPAGRSR